MSTFLANTYADCQNINFQAAFHLLICSKSCHYKRALLE